MLWSNYYPLIVFWKFVPFLLNLIAQNIVTLLGSELIHGITVKDTVIMDSNMSFTILYAGCFIIEVCWFYNFWGEAKEWRRDGWNYLKDPWNYLDLSITILTQVYMGQFMSDLWFERGIFSVTAIRTMGGMVVFLLWIKMFYWLRLFSSTAYFIKLILNTIFDLRNFFILILIIMASFITMFYVFQQNLKGVVNDKGEQVRYIDEHTGYQLIDAILTIYFIMVGEFYTEDFKHGPNFVIIWPMFLVCNFLMAIVFMNMLIAIMSQTFTEV